MFFFVRFYPAIRGNKLIGNCADFVEWIVEGIISSDSAGGYKMRIKKYLVEIKKKKNSNYCVIFNVELEKYKTVS